MCLPFSTGLIVLTSPLLGNNTRRLISVRNAAHLKGPRLNSGLTRSMAFPDSDIVSNVCTPRGSENAVGQAHFIGELFGLAVRTLCRIQLILTRVTSSGNFATKP
jgi:hypothetical protein